ncbi:MAG: TolC family protein [Chitinophagaceae bacterium]|nr:TolC family protein [Chitinophagaceae bacterium]
MKFFFVIIFLGLFGSSGFCQNNRLDYYVDQALTNSPLLKDYRNQVQSSYYDSLLIMAAYKPQVTGNTYNAYAPVIKGWGYDDAITNGANINALVGVNKQLLNKKTVAAQFQNIRLQNESLNNTGKITEQDLKRTIIAQYITAYGDLQQLNFNKQINSLLTKQDTILKKLTQSNVFKQVDYLAFLVTLQQQALVIKQQEMQYRNDYALLNYLCGITDTATVELADPEIRSNRLPDISGSVFFKQFEIDSLKLLNSRELLKINYRPKISLFADAGYNSSLAYKPYKNIGTSFGISATIPIYDGRQKEFQVSKINIAERNRSNYKEFFIRQYSQQVAQLTQQLHETEEMISTIDAQLKYAQSLIDVNGKLLNAGEVRVADYILALNNYMSAKNLITQNRINRMQIINQINYWNR